MVNPLSSTDVCMPTERGVKECNCWPSEETLMSSNTIVGRNKVLDWIDIQAFKKASHTVSSYVIDLNTNDSVFILPHGY